MSSLVFLSEQDQYQSIFPEDSTSIQDTGTDLVSQKVAMLSPMKLSKKAIIDRAESLVVAEFTSESHRKNNFSKSKPSSKNLTRFSTFQSFNDDGDEDEREDSAHKEELPEDHFIPYSTKDNVEISYLLHENTRIAKLIKEQVIIFNSYFALIPGS